MSEPLPTMPPSTLAPSTNPPRMPVASPQVAPAPQAQPIQTYQPPQAPPAQPIQTYQPPQAPPAQPIQTYQPPQPPQAQPIQTYQPPKAVSTEPVPPQPVSPQPFAQPILPNSAEPKKAAPSRRFFWMILLILILSLLGLTAAYYQGWLPEVPRNRAPVISLASPSPTIAETDALPSDSVPVISEDSSEAPPATVSADTAVPTPSASPEVSGIPSGWVLHSFPQQRLQIATPKGWQSEVENFIQDDTQIFRFWQGGSSATATIQLTSQPDWENTGNAQDLPRTATIAKNIQAAKVDPPTMQEQKLDRYQTNYYFEQAGRVYIFNCVHNWIPTLYSQCQTMLTTLTGI